MWLTVSRRSVKKAEPLVVEKINLENLSFLHCVSLCYSGLSEAEKWPQF